MYDGFWRNMREENRRAILQDYGVINKVWYLFPQGGGPRGSFETFTSLKPNLRSRDLIYLSGVLREQAVCPVGVLDVTVLGAANQPRQATNGGVPTGGGASWLAPTTPVATTPLIRVIEQGWIFENIQFAPVAASPCITFDRRETAAIPDSSHGIVRGCYFSTGGASGHGIELIEVKKTIIEDCLFEALTGAGGYAIKNTAGGGVAAVSHSLIQRNRFIQNANDILITSGQYNTVKNNVFTQTDVLLAGTRVSFTLGLNNVVIDNSFKDVAADVTIAKGYAPGVTGQWRNWTSDTNVPIVTVPA